jgi:poly-beta-1,6-N-acetyl-D-glucosamine biosynthesis protein PgaD
MSIIDGRQKKKWRIAEMVVTIFGWFVLLGFTLQIILSILLWFFNLSYIYNELIILGSVEDSIFIFTVTIIISLCSFAFLYFWGHYNFRKYGHLDRRSFPKSVTSEELAVYFSMPVSEVERFTKEKLLTLEENIIFEVDEEKKDQKLAV